MYSDSYGILCSLQLTMLWVLSDIGQIVSLELKKMLSEIGTDWAVNIYIVFRCF